MRVVDPTPEEEKEWTEWVESRPPVVRDIARRIDPWTLYLMPETEQLLTMVSISEDATVRVCIWGRTDGFDILYPRGVFGVVPSEFVPAEAGTRIPGALQQELDKLE